MPDDNSPCDVFIIYSRKDLKAVERIKNELESLGFSCWMGNDGIECGEENIQREIVSALNRCKVVLLVISADSQKSEWTGKELAYAKRQGKRVVPLRFNEDPLVGEFAFDYGGANIIDWRQQDQQQKLKMDLERWLPKEGSTKLASECGMCYYTCDRFSHRSSNRRSMRENVKYEAGERALSFCVNRARAIGATASSPLGIASGLLGSCASVFGMLKKKHGLVAGMNAKHERSATVQLDQVDFSAIAPRMMKVGASSVIQIVMYEKGSRAEVDAIIRAAEWPVRETRSGNVSVARSAKIRIVLSSPDFKIDDCVEEGEWSGGYRVFSFYAQLPVGFVKPQALFVATVYIQDVVATKLKFIVSCNGMADAKPNIQRQDVNSAFISYASEDRPCVINAIQGMLKVRPDLDVFLDVAKLRSGEDWEERLYKEIGDRDVLYLFWSRHAKQSERVEREWRYAFKTKGIEGIEPFPIEPAENCPPPKELSKLHFNDYLQYLAQGITSAHGC